MVVGRHQLGRRRPPAGTPGTTRRRRPVPGPTRVRRAAPRTGAPASSPTPTPGECCGASGPWRNGSKIDVADLGRDPGPVVLDRDHDAVRVRAAPAPRSSRSMGCAARCWRAGSPRCARPSRRRPVGRPAAARSRSRESAISRSRRGRAATSAPTSVDSSLGATMPRASRSRSSRLVTRRSSRRAFAGDAVRQVLRVVLVELDVAAFQGDREAEDRGERRAQVVRDRLQERVLHLVERPQALGGLALDVEGALELRLGFLALGDVEQESLPVRGLARQLAPAWPRPGPRRCGRPCRSSGIPSRRRSRPPPVLLSASASSTRSRSSGWMIARHSVGSSWMSSSV